MTLRRLLPWTVAACLAACSTSPTVGGPVLLTDVGGVDGTSLPDGATPADDVEADAPGDATAADADDTAAGTDATGPDADDTAAGTDATALDTDDTAAGTDATGLDTDDTAAGTDAIGPDTDDIAAGTDAIGPDSNDTAAGNDATVLDTSDTGPDVPVDPCAGKVCNDDNACTTDACSGGTCTYTAIAGCKPAAVPCDGNNPCAAGFCDPGSNACVQCLTTAQCQDASLGGKPGMLCLGHACQPAPTCKSDVECKATQQVCDKGSSVCVDCTASSDCATGQACVATKCVAAPACKSSKDCDAVCDQAAGVCVQCLGPDDCKAGEYCNATHRCVADVCSGPACGPKLAFFVCKADGSGFQTGVPCDDGNLCTDTACTSTKGCAQVPNSAACIDGSACTTGDICSGGTCKGTPISCDDGNPCTDDACDPAGGCKHTSNTVACDDGSVCTGSDKCFGGKCQGVTLGCDDTNPCTDDTCDAKSGCVHVGNSAACTDGSACTSGEKCLGGKCQGGVAMVCNDGNSCTTDSCDPGKGCVFQASAALGTVCDDGNACTFSDVCSGGLCAGQAGKCEDGNLCTDDSCDPKVGCVFAANSAPCDDNNKCTDKDTCAGGSCKPGSVPACDDGNSCTSDTCDQALGCKFVPQSGPCSDGNACTVGDACGNGKCNAGAPGTCNDGSKCTSDGCDPIKGCVYTDLNACDDKNGCTADSCDAATGGCSHAAIPGCTCTSATAASWSFDGGAPVGIVYANSSTVVGWQVWDPATQSKSGKGVLYYGSPSKQNYVTGDVFTGGTNSGTATFPAVNLPATGKRFLKASLWLAVEKYSNYDKFSVSIVNAATKAETVVWAKTSTYLPLAGNDPSYGQYLTMPTGWLDINVEIPAGAGTSVQVKFAFDTVDGTNNDTLGVLVDDLAITTTCQ